MVIHVGNVRARLHDTGGRGGFRNGACSLQLMPHWIENFIPVRQSQISIRTTTWFRRKSASWMSTCVILVNPRWRRLRYTSRPVFNSPWCDISFKKEAEFYPIVIRTNVVNPRGGYLMGNRSFHLSVVSQMSLVVSFMKRNERAASWE